MLGTLLERAVGLYRTYTFVFLIGVVANIRPSYELRCCENGRRVIWFFFCWYSTRSKARQNSDYRNSISENSIASNPLGSRPNTKSSSGGNHASNGGGGSKTHSDASRNGTSNGSASDGGHVAHKNATDTNPSSSTTTASQRVAVTSNSQDCTQQYIQSKDAALPPR